MTPEISTEALEELKEIVHGAHGEMDEHILHAFVQLNAFIKKHTPKPKWPPEEGQEIFILDATGYITKTSYHIGFNNILLMAPYREMAEYVHDWLSNQTIEDWERMMKDEPVF